MRLNMRVELVSRLIAMAILATATFAAETALGQVQLRWKFVQGEDLYYEMMQSMRMRTNVGGAQSGSDMTQVMNSKWHVTEVLDDGSAKIDMSIEKVVMDLEAGAMKFRFDSSQQQVDPQAQMIAGLMRPLVGAVFKFRITPLGEIVDVVVPEGLSEKLKASPLAGAMGGSFSEEGLKQMTQQSSLELPPDGLQKGQTWGDEKEINGLHMDVTYKYLGTQDVEGQPLHAISVDSTMELTEPPAPGAEVEISEQSAKGTNLFDAERGRLVETKVEQKFVMDITVQDNTFNQDVTQIIQNRLVDPNEDGSSNE